MRSRKSGTDLGLMPTNPDRYDGLGFLSSVSKAFASRHFRLRRSARRRGLINLLQHPALNHHCQITSGVLQKDCAAISREFFRKKTIAEKGLEEPSLDD
jgi:hypothetical protein